MNRIAGIDLGTTHSLLAVRRGGETICVPNSQGALLTPSAVAFPRGREPLVGEAALASALAGEPVVTSVKRLMGTDSSLSVGDRDVSPVEVSAQILRKVAGDASAALGWRVRDVVLTVPAYFNARQREDTAAAADLAGLRVARLLNEPTAAALAYGLADERPQTLVVWDLGGGTFDVSVLRFGHGVFQVAAVNGDSQLGGDDWDRLLAEFLRQAIPSPGERPQLDWRLLHAARAARERLTAAEDTIAHVPRSAAPGTVPSARPVDLHRREFEELTRPLLELLLGPTRQALADAGIDTAEVDRVLLAGGATRMPAVQALAFRFFGVRPVGIDRPDLLVAMGAAVQAFSLEGDRSGETLVDVIPMTLGVEVAGGLVAPLILRNTSLPARADRLFTVAADGQTSAHIHVIQGERPRAAENVTLGRFDLDGMSGLPRGKACIEVAFEVDSGGILQVSAFDLHTRSWRKVEIVPFRSAARNLPDSAA